MNKTNVATKRRKVARGAVTTARSGRPAVRDGSTAGRLSAAQKRYLELGLSQPGGKLPLFGASGLRINPATIRSCVDRGFCTPWYRNPIEPDWLVCKLTDAGRQALGGETPKRD